MWNIFQRPDAAQTPQELVRRQTTGDGQPELKPGSPSSGARVPTVTDRRDGQYPVPGSATSTNSTASNDAALPYGVQQPRSDDQRPGAQKIRGGQ